MRAQLEPAAFPAVDVVAGLRRIAATEGSASALWSGARVNVARAAVLSAAQLATYDAAKRRLGWEEGPRLHVAAAVAAGAVAQTLVQPLDALRTRLCAGGEAPGRPPAGLFRGYAAGLLRQGPVLALTLSLTERARAGLGLAPM